MTLKSFIHTSETDDKLLFVGWVSDFISHYGIKYRACCIAEAFCLRTVVFITARISFCICGLTYLSFLCSNHANSCGWSNAFKRSSCMRLPSCSSPSPRSPSACRARNWIHWAIVTRHLWFNSFLAACAEDSSSPSSPVVLDRVTSPTAVLWVVESTWLEKLTVASF